MLTTHPLPRCVAAGLVLASVLAPLAASDITVSVDPRIFALDASPHYGAICCSNPQSHILDTVWRFGKRKGGYSRLEAPQPEYLIERGLLDPAERTR